MYVVSQLNLGVPQGSRDAFTLLQISGTVSADLATRMQHIVGFGNVAAHEYTRLHWDMVYAIITKQLEDLRTFSSTIVNAFP
ncbi:MAG: DUF86 domain-containing protein [Nitrospirota bacterium]|nr:DUF86 domain-containing protein [Nitrospirota bacterium]MDP2383364.1 DUF86 domain-containing protein [Nitrospirota bacterium]MDP3599269.1 DUF86 domain-containing protein [Nitrospirota bacterium]